MIVDADAETDAETKTEEPRVSRSRSPVRPGVVVVYAADAPTCRSIALENRTIKIGRGARCELAVGDYFPVNMSRSPSMDRSGSSPVCVRRTVEVERLDDRARGDIHDPPRATAIVGPRWEDATFYSPALTPAANEPRSPTRSSERVSSST